MGSLVLDLLLLIIFLMMLPIGFYRGGLREISVSAALMLSILLAQSWAESWSTILVSIFGMSKNNAIFLMSALIMVVITGFIGYGGSAAFSWKPGPGGRLYGAYLALINAMVATGFLIHLYGLYIAPDAQGNHITNGILARTLGEGFGGVLLFATLGVVIATIFGMFVRDRADDLPSWEQESATAYQPPMPTRPYRAPQNIEPVSDLPEPVRIVDVEEWQDQNEPAKPNPGTYGSGWRQTWPDSSPITTTRPPKRNPASTAGRPSAETPSQIAGQDVLADWIKSQDDS